MAHSCWLRERQLENIQPFFLRERGGRPVDDRKALRCFPRIRSSIETSENREMASSWWPLNTPWAAK